MSVGQSERKTQNRVIRLFRDKLGYRYLGDWTARTGDGQILHAPADGELLPPGDLSGTGSFPS